MKSVVIFKIYRNSFQSDDYHDIMDDYYKKTVSQLEAKTREYGRKAVIISGFGNTVDNIIVNTPYLELLYTGELSKEEKEAYISILKRLFSDIDCKDKEYVTEIVIRFSKITDGDIIEITQKEPIHTLKNILGQ